MNFTPPMSSPLDCFKWFLVTLLRTTKHVWFTVYEAPLKILPQTHDHKFQVKERLKRTVEDEPSNLKTGRKYFPCSFPWSFSTKPLLFHQFSHHIPARRNFKN